MSIGRRLLPISILSAILFSPQAGLAGDADLWDGTWSGTLGRTNPWPISVSISHGKVVTFIEKGAPFDVQYSKVTAESVMFGDQRHYSMKLTKTGDTTAAVKVHGRHGVGTGVLTKG
jgi:hypothetical protein